MDLLDFFRRGRPWPQLSRFLRRLPNFGQYKAALADDDEYAAILAMLPPSPPQVPIVGYDPIMSRLDTLIDVFIAAHSSGSGTTPRMPRPVTALDRLQSKTARSRHRERVAMLLPGKST